MKKIDKELTYSNKPTLKERLDSLHNNIVLPAIKNALKDTKRALVVLPTGSGKTRVAAKAIAAWFETAKKGRKVVFITHKLDIKADALEELKLSIPDKRIGFFEGADSLKAYDVVIAMIQTIGRDTHLDRLDAGRVGLVVVDEGHHVAASRYRRFLEKFKLAERIGLTATHLRPDGQSITTVKKDEDTEEHELIFGEPCVHVNIREGIDSRIYANPDAWVVLTSSKIKGLPSTTTGEYSTKVVDRFVVSKSRNKTILNSYLDLGRKAAKKKNVKPKFIGFAINVKHARRMANYFSNNGVPSAFVVGNAAELSMEERNKILYKFKTTNEIEVLWAVDLLNEGSNIPDVNGLLMCRPTRSNIIYTQQLGRGTRWIDGVKESIIVLDYADITRQGFHNYQCSNVTGSATPRDKIETRYTEDLDPVELQERICAVQNILDYEKARYNFYPIKEDAYLSCLSLGINNISSYKAKRILDGRLPANPSSIYSDWNFGVLSGKFSRPRRLIQHIETGRIFESVSSAAKYYKTAPSNIYASLTTNNPRWAWIDKATLKGEDEL